MDDKTKKFVRYALMYTKLKDFNQKIIEEHVAHIRSLDDRGILEICGPFLDYKGGMVVVRAADIDEARKIAESDPFVRDGYESYEVRTWLIGCRENNYLL